MLVLKTLYFYAPLLSVHGTPAWCSLVNLYMYAHNYSPLLINSVEIIHTCTGGAFFHRLDSVVFRILISIIGKTMECSNQPGSIHKVNYSKFS